MRRIGNAERLSRQLALLGRGERSLWRVLTHGCTKVAAPISVEKWGRFHAKNRKSVQTAFRISIVVMMNDRYRRRCSI